MGWRQRLGSTSVPGKIPYFVNHGRAAFAVCGPLLVLIGACSSRWHGLEVEIRIVKWSVSTVSLPHQDATVGNTTITRRTARPHKAAERYAFAYVINAEKYGQKTEGCYVDRSLASSRRTLVREPINNVT